MWRARADADVTIAMNPKSVEQDIEELRPGSILIVNDLLKGLVNRDDLTVVYVPFSQLVKDVSSDTRLRKKILNMIYVGVVARLLNIDMDAIHSALSRQFSGKEAAVTINQSAIDIGFDWAGSHIEFDSPYVIEAREKDPDTILIEGNEAAALGMVFGGVTVCAWYPITPSSSVCENLTRYLDEYRRDPETGKATYAVIQAEDEIASLGIVLGAGWMGARACTATVRPRAVADGRDGGPGLSRGSPGRGGRCATHGPEHRPPDAHQPGRYARGVQTCRMAIRSIFYSFRGRSRSVSHIHRCRWIWRNSCRPWFWS